ncbi:alpha/beta hydrolase [Humibacter ginsenosidimutans]|uniref:alpha/beta hydrolase n=1 Tax=Humibacter ginsenosidimutans TaxID=2599293 RepID=UPI001AEF9A07|nr:alpha/beta hydrolase [Humibacter ginsenosidimutans]
MNITSSSPSSSSASSASSSSLQFDPPTTADGILERPFRLGGVAGVLWAAEAATDAAPLLLMGHGGGLHARHPGLVGRARAAVMRDGFTVVAIDSPGHGERPRSDEDQRWVDAMVLARDAGRPIAGIVSEFNGSLAERAVPEWRATLDALQALPEVEPDVSVGFQGMTLASEIGIRLAAQDARITAAIFGGVFASDELLDAASRVTIPVEILLPWDDAELGRESGLALFDAFGSSDKTLHVFPGSHFRVPEAQVDTRFFARHLRR